MLVWCLRAFIVQRVSGYINGFPITHYKFPNKRYPHKCCESLTLLESHRRRQGMQRLHHMNARAEVTNNGGGRGPNAYVHGADGTSRAAKYMKPWRRQRRLTMAATAVSDSRSSLLCECAPNVFLLFHPLCTLTNMCIKHTLACTFVSFLFVSINSFVVEKGKSRGSQYYLTLFDSDPFALMLSCSSSAPSERKRQNDRGNDLSCQRPDTRASECERMSVSVSLPHLILPRLHSHPTIMQQIPNV